MVFKVVLRSAIPIALVLYASIVIVTSCVGTTKTQPLRPLFSGSELIATASTFIEDGKESAFSSSNVDESNLYLNHRQKINDFAKKVGHNIQLQLRHQSERQEENNNTNNGKRKLVTDLTTFLINQRADEASSCVYDENQLRTAIANVVPNRNSTRTISLCTKTIKLSNTIDPVYGITGIDLSGKSIRLLCRNTSSRCIIDAQKASRIFYGFGTKFIASDIEFRNGFSNTDSLNFGSALTFFNESIITIIRCSFRQNSAYAGGAIYIENSNLSLVGAAKSRTVIVGNEAYGNGAIYLVNSTMKADHIAIARNKATASDVSGLSVEGSYIDMDNVIVKGNSASRRGGAIRLFRTNATLNLFEFTSNTAALGAGALVAFRSNVYVGNSVFSRNSAELSPGAVYVDSSNLNFDNVKFRNNSADGGYGAMEVYYSNITVKQNEFDGNTGANGAVQLQDSSGTFYFSVFSKNEARDILDPKSAALQLSTSKSQFFNITFANNKARGLQTFSSSAIFNNAVFSNNTGGNSSNIYIEDNLEPFGGGGSFVDCNTGAVFCSKGLGSIFIVDDPSIANTNCRTKGIREKPGVGVCNV